jgi:hypothetical protein
MRCLLHKAEKVQEGDARMLLEKPMPGQTFFRLANPALFTCCKY